MKDGKELDTEQIHRLLDGDLGPDEKKALMDRVQADPVLREEFEGLTGALRAIETSERMPAPSFFTAEVMRRLPPRKATIGKPGSRFSAQGQDAQMEHGHGICGHGDPGSDIYPGCSHTEHTR